MKKTVREFDVQDMLPIGITIVVIGVALAYGLSVLGDVKDDIGETSCAANSGDYTGYDAATDLCYNASNSSQTQAVGASEFNATDDAITGVGKLPAKLGTIVSVIVAAIIIGILVRYLMVR